ncbi:FAD-binding and (Fe-S)-binding domain-containing protein [Thaumasiovibrio sp. DFM-14]|uniref:D-2-hydroxyglutarate dehydrogenase YdiJ n=1 Tax=Thaumasiovibrio sp. DFM-14 TaxID=3384792 RepID=UPI0039A2F2D2
MLPLLPFQASIDNAVLQYIDLLNATSFQGDVEVAYASRLSVATDNSVYQQLPQAVIFPRSTNDVVLIGEVAKQCPAVSFSARGGGTGTNGQSLTPGVVVDLSRYMTQILEVNIEQGWVKVEAGVIKDQLNDVLRPHGYFFSPDLSTSNRATIGGMINTDASGQGSLKYGKTSDHVLALKAVLADGSVLDTEQGLTNGLASIACSVTEEVCRQQRSEIENKFPDLNRFLTGYDLKNALNVADDTFDITRVLCGSEGSLAMITEAKLNITPIPTARTVVNIKYDSFDAALRNAPMMVQAQALSVETIDSKVLNLAKQDIVWHTVRDLITDVPDAEVLGINVVEYAGQNREDNDQQVAALCRQLDTLIAEKVSGILGYQVCSDLADINKIYAMRKKAVGLLGATKGHAKPIPFAEDTCVPPQNLADFISEFRQLLDSHQLHYGMFGHVDAGVLHVRPALDMCDPEQEALMKSLSDDVVALVAKYGGLMWGEHGKGYRSEYGPAFFGDVLFTELRRIKAAFDPHNQMNPGKICTPLGSGDELVKVDAIKRGYYDRQIPIKVRDSYSAAMGCNGNGLCFNYDTSSPMCPSMKVTADRRQSPKGRAGLVREWLRLLSEQGVDILALEQQTMQRGPSLKALIDRFKQTYIDKQYDFSHEVMEAMQGCLACKACASQCPIKVDVPSFRARFMNLYYSRYQRPLKDYLVAYIEVLLPWMAKMPKVINTLSTNRVSEFVLRKSIGYRDTPALSVPTLSASLASHHALRFDLLWLQALSIEERARYVLVVQDPFTSYYDAEVVSDFVHLIEKLGKKPILVPFNPNGKAQHIKGFLRQFTQTARTTSAFLNQLAELKIPMVGVDPALVLCYRDEYDEVLADKRGEFEVLLAHEWLMPLIAERQPYPDREDAPWYLFAHCTEKTKLPNAEKEWGAIFQHFGAALNSVPVGCCGMAGTFGHETEKYAVSKAVFDLSWKPTLDEIPDHRAMITGYSCRSQVKRLQGQRLLHPVQVLLRLI